MEARFVIGAKGIPGPGVGTGSEILRSSREGGKLEGRRESVGSQSWAHSWPLWDGFIEAQKAVWGRVVLVTCPGPGLIAGTSSVIILKRVVVCGQNPDLLLGTLCLPLINHVILDE